MATFRYIIDVSDAACATYPGFTVIVDSHAGNQVVALCPITDEPVCEGYYSMAPLVQRALEREGHARAVAAAHALTGNVYTEPFDV